MQTVHLVNKKVLLVETKTKNREILKNFLHEIGINSISEAENGYEALKFFDKSPYWADIVICSWDMPGMSGIELFRELRTTHPQMPFVIMTSRTDSESVAIARDAGLDGYLIEPPSTVELEKKIVGAFKKMTAQPPLTNSAYFF